MLRRPDAELRIPFAAIARVHAERRHLAVELLAPAGATSTVYRVADVSAAGASAFADAVNAALPPCATDEEPVDGSTLVVTRSFASDEEEEVVEDASGNEIRDGVSPHGGWPAYTAHAAVAVLALVVGLIGEDLSRGIATLLLGETGVWLASDSVRYLILAWRQWYLARYGITVNWRSGSSRTASSLPRPRSPTPRPVTRSRPPTASRHIHTGIWVKPVQVAYQPSNAENAVIRAGTRGQVETVAFSLFIAAVAGFVFYGIYRLTLPAFGG